jgi:hypothetical protein
VGTDASHSRRSVFVTKYRVLSVPLKQATDLNVGVNYPRCYRRAPEKVFHCLAVCRTLVMTEVWPDTNTHISIGLEAGEINNRVYSDTSANE